MATGERRGSAGTVGAVGLGVLTVSCCAGLPLVAGFVGGLSLAAALGAGLGVLAVGLAIGAAGLAMRRWRREARSGSQARLGSRR